MHNNAHELQYFWGVKAVSWQWALLKYGSQIMEELKLQTCNNILKRSIEWFFFQHESIQSTLLEWNVCSWETPSTCIVQPLVEKAIDLDAIMHLSKWKTWYCLGLQSLRGLAHLFIQYRRCHMPKLLSVNRWGSHCLTCSYYTTAPSTPTYKGTHTLHQLKTTLN